jgi:para-nitrobenzyl esterase
VVTTRSGRVIGTRDEHDTLAWRGIPYGRPPVGDLRWRAPRDPEPWRDVRAAGSFGPAPWQPGTPGSSEDCLYLNVWRPGHDRDRLPVYVWLPGGANRRQLPALSDTSGALLASRSDVVAVTVSYRVGEMGWFTHPALREGADVLDASGNYGTLDIIRALRWARSNVEQFGGDPANVLVTGESAGAYNTLTLLISPAAAGLFDKVMAQSGRTDSHAVERGDAQAEAIACRLLAGEHGGDAAGARARAGMAGAEMAAFLRRRRPEEVAAAAQEPFLAGFRDGTVIHARGFACLGDGGCPSRVPAILGMNQEESKFFLSRRNPELQEDRELYEMVAGIASAQKRAAGCDGVLRRLAANAGQPPVYGYLFRWGWGGEHPSPLPDPLSWTLGAAHAMDIPFFLHGGEWPVMAAAGFDERNRRGRIALAGAMMGYLRNFAHTGEPGSPRPDLPVWEPWSNDAAGPKHIIFDADCERALVRMGREELGVAEVRARLAALPDRARELAVATERSFAGPRR